jgi:hypothetical protein
MESHGLTFIACREPASLEELLTHWEGGSLLIAIDLASPMKPQMPSGFSKIHRAEPLSSLCLQPSNPEFNCSTPSKCHRFAAQVIRKRPSGIVALVK